jgi:hypothetical protein
MKPGYMLLILLAFSASAPVGLTALQGNEPTTAQDKESPMLGWGAGAPKQQSW